MRWFKHMVRTTRDEKIARLIGKGGEAGLARYAAFWLVAETIAEHIEPGNPKTEITYPLWRWARILFTTPKHARGLLEALGGELVYFKSGQISDQQVPDSEISITIQMPNLMKYKDEYARKSGVAPDNIAPEQSRGQIQSKKKQKTLPKDKPSADSRFAEFRHDFEAYFKHMNKAPASWDAKQASALSKWLKANPTITRDKWRNVLRNRRVSPVNHAAELAAWMSKALSWLNGTADEWGKQITGGGTTNGKSNGTTKADRTAAALDEAINGGSDPHDGFSFDGCAEGGGGQHDLFTGDGGSVIDGEFNASSTGTGKTKPN